MLIEKVGEPAALELLAEECVELAHAGHYVKFYGTFKEARDKMFEKYGKDWAFQYSEEEWEA